MRIKGGFLRAAGCETLEPRRLLASFASLNAHGTLSVVGTSGDDHIAVQFTDTTVQAIRNGNTVSFSKSAVKRIWVNGFGGNDSIVNKTNRPSTLIGGAANDVLVGGKGNDLLVGGAGKDSVDYSSRSGKWSFFTPPPFSEDANDPMGQAISGVESDLINQDIETYIGSQQNDSFSFNRSLNQRAYICDGRGGNDFFNMGNRETATVFGGSGDDTFDIHDEGGSQTIFGQGGNDLIVPIGEVGAPDFFDGGSGRDAYSMGGTFATSIDLHDYVSVEDVINIGVFKPAFGGFLVIGNDLHNRLIAAKGTDVPISMEGLGGNDTLIGGDGSDDLDGGAGRDMLFGNGEDDRLFTKDGEKDTLDGGDGDDSAERDNSASVKDQVLNVEQLA
jgi:Ca2+-binding RTX toxin-like protein